MHIVIFFSDCIITILMSTQNGRHFSDDILKCIFDWMEMNELRIVFLEGSAKQYSSIGSDNGEEPIGR